jgi:hypothetical protein
LLLAGLPLAERQSERWKTASKALLQNAEHRGHVVHTRRAVMRALHRREVQAMMPRR